MSSYFAPLVTLPNVINAPGRYITRSGDEVTVSVVSSHHDFRCKGGYADGTREGWHKSGRIFAGTETRNDIIRSSNMPLGAC